MKKLQYYKKWLESAEEELEKAIFDKKWLSRLMLKDGVYKKDVEKAEKNIQVLSEWVTFMKEEIEELKKELESRRKKVESTIVQDVAKKL